MKTSKLALTLAALAAISVSAGACSGSGDDDDDGGSFSDNGGDGTGTLRIIAALAVDADGEFTANVSLANESNTIVQGATVTLRTPEQGDIVLDEQVGFGTYVLPAGTWDYASGFGLDVDGGADGNAFGIGFNAPDLTQVTSPQNQDVVPISQDLTVTWAGRGADQHRLELTVHDYDSNWVDGDTGSDVILGAVITSSASVETLTVRRRREFDISSGRPGSVFSAQLEDVIEPLGVQ